MLCKMNAILIDGCDSVVTVTQAVKKGECVCYRIDGKDVELSALDDIPMYHKIAVTDIAVGEGVYKYGQYIGRALCDIRAGEHIHTHNLG